MSVPTIFVLNTIMALYLRWSFPKAMLGYALPLLCSVLIGMIGYILNLIFPNFEWENVTHIIKQSLPAILTALIGVVVTCGTAYLLLRFFPNALFMGSWIACAANLLSTFEASGEIIETYGAFESYGDVSYVADKTDDGIEFVRVIQIANYEKGKLTFTASFFEDGSVAGFRMAE